MSTLFDDLKQGLQEAIAYEKGQGTARIKTYTIAPVKEYSSAEIRNIRMKAGMTQSVFAAYMGVSKKQLRPGKEDGLILPVQRSAYWKC